MSDRRVFLGWVDKNKVKPSSLVVPWNGGSGQEHLAATWNRGAGASPHALIVGTTGGGKSSLLRLLLLDLVRQPGTRDITIIDGAGAGEYAMFRSVPGVEIINSNEDATPGSVKLAAEALRFAQEEVVTRNAAFQKAQDEAERTRKTPSYEPPDELIVVIDEWMAMFWDFAQVIGRAPGKKPQASPVAQAIQIGRLGRKVGVHLVIATQRPDAKSDESGLPGELKAQLGCRIAAVGPLGMLPIESLMCFGDTDTGHLAPNVLGGCVMRVGNTKVPFTAPKMVNPTTVDRSVTDEERAAVWAMLPKVAA